MFFRKKGDKKVDKASFYPEIGKLIYSKHSEEFADFYASAPLDEDRRPIDVVFEFGDDNHLVVVFDWRGEDNEGELGEYIEENVGRGLEWIHTSAVRAVSGDTNQRNGRFFVDLLNAADKDLGAIGLRLLFLNRGGDSYEFAVVDNATFNAVMGMGSGDFHGVQKLRR